ncbi:uncharacterized protein HMF8227_00009 [Saliniradius amylolyticus]|uniref:DUF2489 domain-containing protein n=1 Tax=Saliniradius amylolyticus TaxID=2183582 RepID=A0A2S2DYU5_9ALTE|nr:DUF2489 domain-containing protein [Saliniradius amylolyticus]AWL10523.1 uncharacterized protein HMF8227_00009 [Saliniradius amylolyticus]
MLITILITSAALIVLGLGFYAGKLLCQLRHQQQQRQQAEEKRKAYVHQSIQTIAKAVEQQQCGLSEASIRLCVLLDNLPDREEQDYARQFPALHDLYDRIKHMPTHDAWKALPKKERRKMELQQGQFEAELETAILKEAEQLRQRF